MGAFSPLHKSLTENPQLFYLSGIMTIWSDTDTYVYQHKPHKDSLNSVTVMPTLKYWKFTPEEEVQPTICIYEGAEKEKKSSAPDSDLHWNTTSCTPLTLF